MRSAFSLALPLALSLAAAACTTIPTVDVTRFHLSQPIPLDTVSVVSATALPPTLEAEQRLKAVADELERLGFKPVPDTGSSTYIATLRAEQTSHAGAPQGGSPISIGIGGGSFGRGGGVSGGINFPLGGGDSSGSTVIGNLVMLELKRRADNAIVWEGRALQEVSAKAPSATLNTAVPQLVRALFDGFPGPSGEMVQVPVK